MPGFDGTGPFGRGAMTGRGHGYCASEVQCVPFRQPENRFFCRPRFGLGMRRGWGGWNKRGRKVW